MRLQYTYEESDCYEYDPPATFINGAPPIRTEGIPVGWKKGSFAEQDGLDLSSFNVRNRRYNNKAGNTNLDDINNWNSGYWATVLITPKHAIGCRHYWRTVPTQERKPRFMGKSGKMYYPEWESTTEFNGDRILITFKEELPDDVTPIEGCDVGYVPVGSKIYQLTNQGMLHYMYTKGGKVATWGSGPTRVYDFEYEVDPVMGEREAIWSGDSGTPTFVKDEQNGKLYWLGNKWGGFPFSRESNSTMEIVEHLKGLTSDDRPTGYDWKIAQLSGGEMDYNNDGVIDSADLGHVLAAFGMDAKGYYEQFDLNDDGKVDSGDMGKIFAKWGVTADMVTFDPDNPPPPIQDEEKKIVLTPGTGFDAFFASDFDTPARFGQSIAAAEYIQSQDVDGNPIKSNDDTFAADSHPTLALGQPNIFTTDKDCDIDVYTFHGSGIKEVLVSADGGEEINAILVPDETTDGYGGHYKIPITKEGIGAGKNTELRITAVPENGYTRTVQMFLSYTEGENRVKVDSSVTIADGIGLVNKLFDETKRNILELTESAEYELGSDATLLRDFGWIEVEAPEGIEAVIDVSYGSVNYGKRPKVHQVKWNNIVFRSMVKLNDPLALTRGNGGFYLEDTPRTTRWWLDGCRTESNWFSQTIDGTPMWELTDDDENIPNGANIFRNVYNQQIYYTNCFDSETYYGYGNARLVNNCVLDRNYMDALTNVKAVINSKSTRKLNPRAKSRHADHFQQFAGRVNDFVNNQGEEFVVAPVMNRLLYGYEGHDEYQYVQQFGFFGTGKEYYCDIAHVKSKWTGVMSTAGIAQIGIRYDHILNIGLVSENGGLIYRSDGKQYGPCLIKDINMQSLSNGTISPLNQPTGVTEFREAGEISPPMTYSGIPTDDSNLITKFSWFVPPKALGPETEIGNMYIKDGVGEGSLWLGTKAKSWTGIMTPDSEGEEIHLAEVFGLDADSWNERSRFAYTYSPKSILTGMTLTCFPTREAGEEFIASAGEQGWWLKITTDKGFAYSKSPLNLRAGDSKLVSVPNLSSGSLGGDWLNIEEMVESTTGILFELKTMN